MHTQAVREGIMDRISALPYRTLFMFWGLNVFLFACIYAALSYVPGHGPTGLDSLRLSERLASSLYYSVITATNTGYGDIVPLGYSRLFAALQSVTELFLFALFIAKLVSNRQDIALTEVHKLSFELTFHNIREDFYVARKDFDHLIEIARARDSLSESEWERLAVAYQHTTSLLNEVPNFYDVTSDLYVIDPRREILLLEAVQRTTTRITDVLNALSTANIDWKSHHESRGELRELVITLDKLVPLWRDHSHDQNHDAFMRITGALDELHARLETRR